MKKVFITIVCACTALAIMAGASRPDFSRAKQVFKKGPVAATTSVGQSTTGQVSLQQFMREHNVTPNDNRIMRKAPQRDMSRDVDGLKIMTVEVHPVDFDDEGYGIVSETAYGMGWSTFIMNLINHSEINGFYGSNKLPFYIEDGTPWILSCMLRDDTVSSNPYTESAARYRNDTIRWIVCIMMDDEYAELLDPVPGTLYEDGSMRFDVNYYVYSEEIINKYRVRPNGQTVAFVSADTIATMSPVYSNIYLLEPNAYHMCDYELVHSSLNPLDIDLSRVDWGSLIVSPDTTSGGSDSGGSGGSGIEASTVVIGGDDPYTQMGVHPHPVPPRKTPSAAILREDPWNWTDWWTVQTAGTLDAPVYLYQLNDSTICIYNLYNAGYTSNFMTWNSDGVMTFPPQVLFYGNYEDYFNCSVEGDSIIAGNVGTATCDSITWGATCPFSLESQFSYTFDNNRLYLVDGTKFLIGKAEMPTINKIKGYDNYIFTGVTEEEGVEVYLFTVEYDDNGNIVNYVPVDNPYSVAITDEDQIIHLAAIADGYEIGKNPSDTYLADFTVLGVLMPGDVNRDRYLTVADVTALIHHVLVGDFTLSSNFNPIAADVNGDGNWTVSDVTLLIHRILTDE